jgi:hypothetical protein
MNSKKEIVISPTRIVTSLIVFLVLVTAGFIVVPRIPTVFAQKPADVTAEAAARSGTEVFLSVNGKSSKEAWLEKICGMSTPTGCKLAQQVYAPMIWPSIQAKGLRLSCKVVTSNQVPLARTDSATQLWELNTVCTNLDTGETNHSVTRTMVSEDASSGWKFERMLFDEEVQK